MLHIAALCLFVTVSVRGVTAMHFFYARLFALLGSWSCIMQDDDLRRWLKRTSTFDMTSPKHERDSEKKIRQETLEISTFQKLGLPLVRSLRTKQSTPYPTMLL